MISQPRPVARIHPIDLPASTMRPAAFEAMALPRLFPAPVAAPANGANKRRVRAETLQRQAGAAGKVGVVRRRLETGPQLRRNELQILGH